jgi:hypothetical protein
VIPGGEVLPIDAVGQHPRRHQNPELNAGNLIVIGCGTQPKQSLALRAFA